MPSFYLLDIMLCIQCYKFKDNNKPAGQVGNTGTLLITRQICGQTNLWPVNLQTDQVVVRVKSVF